MQHNHHIAMHAGPAADGHDLLAGRARLQLRLKGAPRLLGGGIQYRIPLLVRTADLPLGNGSVRLPWHHLVDANLSSHIDGLLIMAGFRQCLNQRQTGERLGFAPHFHDFSQSGFRIGHHCLDSQAVAVGKLQAVPRLESHGLHGMALDVSGQG